MCSMRNVHSTVHIWREYNLSNLFIREIEKCSTHFALWETGSEMENDSMRMDGWREEEREWEWSSEDMWIINELIR